jgi:superfamily II DNA or RNA helicase
MNFSEWYPIRESAQSIISGLGVKAAQDAMKSMTAVLPSLSPYDRETYSKLTSYLDSDSIPIAEMKKMMSLLSRHRNSHVRNYEDINAMVRKDVATALSKDIASVLSPSVPREKLGSPPDNSSTAGRAPSAGKVKVFDLQDKDYGKVRVYVSKGIEGLGIVDSINSIVDSVLNAENAKPMKDRDTGSMMLPRFKKFANDRRVPETYWIHPSVMGKILDLLKSKGFEVEYESGLQSGAPAPDIQIIGRERTDYGNKLAVRFNYERSKGVFEKMKDAGLSPEGISYSKAGSKFLINIDNLRLFDSVLAHVKAHGLDAKPLEDFAASIGHKPSDAGTGEIPVEKDKVFTFTDASGDSMIVKTHLDSLPSHIKSFIRESIQYNFPEYRYDFDNWSYNVSGSYKQYVTFGRLLSRFGYNVDELRKILKAKLDSGRLGKTDWEGRHDKDKAFMDSIEEKVPDSMIDLYDEQKFGVAFLYGRDSAILGDETGFGKSIQLITAATLRNQSNSKPTLIITLSATQFQFANEILRVMGKMTPEVEQMKKKDLLKYYSENNISLDPMNPKKWTVVKYSDFSGGKDARNKKVKEHIESLKKASFGVAILDELHKVKHGTSQRSENIEEALMGVQTRWGASATVSSNKPMDVKNQLLVMGHQLGRVKEAKFKKDFAGMVEGGYKGALKKSDNEDQEIRAAERLNKWLNLSGVYVRREKGDIREMPELSVTSRDTDIDTSRFNSLYSAKVATYEKPDLAVSKLIAARAVIAQLKTDDTTRKVVEIVHDGEGKPPAASKIVVFTNFTEAGSQLVSKISEAIKAINPNYGVITYLSDTKKKEREQVKRRFTDDPNLKVLVMSMKMGGTGIDFPNAAQHMIINDFDWTPESAEQSEGRLYRINTNHSVNIEYVVGHGLDKELFEKVQQKRRVAAIIQKYRREYHDSEAAPEALRKIVAAQKEIKKIDDEMAKIVANNLPGAEGAMEESFSSYIRRLDEFSEAMSPTE